MSTLRIALTPGEPAGIGPDLCIELAQQPHSHQLVVIADPKLLESRARQLDMALKLVPFDASAAPRPNPAGTLTIQPVPLSEPAVAGHLNPTNAAYVVETLTQAVSGCMDGRFDALVTAPVHKGVINEAGIPFSGHTELLEEQTGAKKVVMMLATQDLRVALATTHLPLREIADAITPRLLREIITVLNHDLQASFGLQQPRILVTGLNPHAGEGGHLGREEIEVIGPTLEQLRREGINLIGPLPADTLFTPKHLQQGDAVLAMYHDQGLPVLKYEGFGRAANITLGLPIIRTSVDHGTALDLAGTGKADIGSLNTALQYAELMARHRRQNV